MTAPSAAERPKAARFLVAAWGLLALLLWLARGWNLHHLHGLLPETLDPELPLDQLRAIASFALLNAAALGWGFVANAGGRLVRGPLDLFGIATLLLVGHVVSALMVFAIGALQLFPWGMTIVFLGAAGLAGRWGELKEVVLQSRQRDGGARRSDGRIHVAWIAVVAAILVPTFLAALAPAVESDGMRYHLFGPQEYLKAGGIVALPWHAFTNLPFQTNMLFTATMWTGGMRAPQLVHWTYLPVIMVCCSALARELGCARMTARCAGALAGSSPVMLAIAGWPFVDLSTCAFTLASVAWIARAARSRDDLAAGALLAGLFAGAAVGTKLTAAIPGVFTGVALLAVALRSGSFAGTLARFAIPAMLVPMPWLAKNVAYHGNPFYPAAFGTFGGPEWSEENDVFYKSKAAEKGFGRSPLDLALSPVDVTVRWATNRSADPPGTFAQRVATRFSPGYEDHNPGPALLALLPVALLWLLSRALRRKATVVDGLLALHLLGGWLAWFFTYQSVRFLLVPLALVAVAGIGGAVAFCGRDGRESRTVLGGGLLLAAAGAAWFAAWALFAKPTYPIPAALGLVSRERVLSGALNHYDAVAFLNDEMADGERALYIGEFRGAYAEGDVLLSDWFDTPRILTEIAGHATNAEMIADWKSRRIRYVLYNHAELRLYAAMYFRPRFTDAEWARFEELDATLRDRTAIAFEPRDGVFVVDVEKLVP